MFDTMKVAKQIKELRLKKNLTQMNLADELGVSYQAVSNWERGNSLPDVGKLGELANILDCSIDELLGKGEDTETVEKIIQNETKKEEEKEDISIQDLAGVISMLKPDDSKSILMTIINEEENLNLRDIVPLAPYLDDEDLDQLMHKANLKENNKDVIALAPFMSDKTLAWVAEELRKGGGLKALIALAPFL